MHSPKGFSTASGKPLKPISEECFQKVRDLFNRDSQLENIEYLDSKEDDRFSSLFSTGKKLTLVSKDVADQFKESSSKKFNSLFSTASGKMLDPVSKDAAQKAASLFSDLAEKSNLDLFTTASGKKLVPVSNEATQKTADLFKDLSNSSSATQDPISSNGVQRCKPDNLFDLEKPVLPSKRSVAKAFSTPLTIKSKKQVNSNKPFRSPNVRKDTDRNHRLDRTAQASLPVFDLTVPKKRGKLTDLGKPLQYNRQQLLSENIPLEILQMTSLSSKKYKFPDWDPLQAQKDMINAGVLPEKISTEWIENHYGWIVWKLACQIRSFPRDFYDDWKPETILNQLLYRYEREINQGHQSVLKKIMDQDDTAAKHMVLVISEIIQITTPLMYNTSSKYKIEVTDGWYKLSACIDIRMEHAIIRSRLRIGHKLSICGAQWIKASSEKTASFLSISTNSCLPVSWDTRLGYQPKKYILRKLSSIFEDGGMVTVLDIVVCRKLPMFYKETLSDGKSIIRTAKEEQRIRRDRQEEMVMTREEGQSDSNGLERKVSGYFKLRICDYGSRTQWATLLLLNMNEFNYMDIEEGSRFKLFFVLPYFPKTKRYPGIHLKTTSMTRWETAQVDVKSSCYVPRYITLCADVYQQNYMLDFDLAVIIIHASPVTSEKYYGQKLYRQKLLVTDSSQALCQIEFGLTFMHLKLIKGQVIGLMNLTFEHYDSKYGITCMKMRDDSEIFSKGTMCGFMKRGLKDLCEWSKENGEVIASVTEKVHSIVQ